MLQVYLLSCNAHGALELSIPYSHVAVVEISTARPLHELSLDMALIIENIVYRDNRSCSLATELCCRPYSLHV